MYPLTKFVYSRSKLFPQQFKYNRHHSEKKQKNTFGYLGNLKTDKRILLIKKKRKEKSTIQEGENFLNFLKEKEETICLNNVNS